MIIDEGKIYNIIDPDKFEKYININPPPKKKKPLLDDEPFDDSFMLGDPSSDNPLKKPKRRTELPFDFKEIPSDLLAKYASLFGNPKGQLPKNQHSSLK